jgi:hypothetical protein
LASAFFGIPRLLFGLHPFQEIRSFAILGLTHTLTVHFFVDPRQVVDDARINAGQVGSGATATPRHYSDQLHAAGHTLGQHWAAAVALTGVFLAVVVAGAHHVSGDSVVGVARIQTLILRPDGYDDRAQGAGWRAFFVGSTPAGNHGQRSGKICGFCLN